MEKDINEIYKFILDEEASWKTTRVPITNSKDWNMSEHIERCTNVSNGWYHSGNNDGKRPYDDIVTPIKNVALRSEGFDVKDIVPYVNDADNYYKSFLIKKFHPQWARKHEIDSFIDDVVESSVVYDLALVKDINGVRPELVPLQSIAFCDQTSILAGPICLLHNYSNAELADFKGRWNSDKIDEAIIMSKASKEVSQASDQEAKTPTKYNKVYELHGNFPESWLKDDGSPNKNVKQVHIVTYYQDKDNKKHGITLFKGPEPKAKFKALVINKIFGRACGMSLVESLFEPQVWNNYSAIRIKEMLDAAALVLYQTDSDEFGNTPVKNLKANTIMKHEPGRPITKIDTSTPNITEFSNHQVKKQNDARLLGSASEAALGQNPVSGTPFALQQLIVNQGEGIHEFRQGKIAAFFADQLYRDWILKYLVNEMNNGKKFSEVLSLDELQEIAETIVSNEIEEDIKKEILKSGKVPTKADRVKLKALKMEEFMKKGNRRFFEIVKDELKDIPIEVYVNIKGKQKYMAQNADKLSNLISNIMKNPQAFAQIPGLGKIYNELLENSGLSPIDFSQMVKLPEQSGQQVQPEMQAPEAAPVAKAA